MQRNVMLGRCNNGVIEPETNTNIATSHWASQKIRYIARFPFDSMTIVMLCN